LTRRPDSLYGRVVEVDLPFGIERELKAAAKAQPYLPVTMVVERGVVKQVELTIESYHLAALTPGLKAVGFRAEDGGRMVWSRYPRR